MRIELASMGWLPYVRRRMRKSGLRLTVRWGRIYTVKAVEITQPETERQLRARDVLARASEAAKREMGDPERRLYWETHAAEMGYKTARGACVAHHVRRLKEDATEAEQRSMEALRLWAEEARKRREERKEKRLARMESVEIEEIVENVRAAHERRRKRARDGNRRMRRQERTVTG